MDLPRCFSKTYDLDLWDSKEPLLQFTLSSAIEMPLQTDLIRTYLFFLSGGGDDYIRVRMSRRGQKFGEVDDVYFFAQQGVGRDRICKERQVEQIFPFQRYIESLALFQFGRHRGRDETDVISCRL